MMSKISIRFFNDKEVRAVWLDNQNCWSFFVDICGALSGVFSTKINDQELFMKGIDYSYYYEEEDN